MALELGVAIELVSLPDLMSVNPDDYGGHPGLKIPTLQVGEVALFGTQNICHRLAELAGRAEDPRVVLCHQVRSDLVRSAQELTWHAMSVQVQLVVGVRIAGLPAENVYFTKARRSLTGSLTWLDAHLEAVLAELPSPRDVSVFEVSLFCLVEHFGFRPTLPLDDFPRLREFAATFATRASAQQTPFRFD